MYNICINYVRGQQHMQSNGKHYVLFIRAPFMERERESKPLPWLALVVSEAK